MTSGQDISEAKPQRALVLAKSCFTVFLNGISHHVPSLDIVERVRFVE